jgi:hypothetical protein
MIGARVAFFAVFLAVVAWLGWRWYSTARAEAPVDPNATPPEGLTPLRTTNPMAAPPLSPEQRWRREVVIAAEGYRNAADAAAAIWTGNAAARDSARVAAIVAEAARVESREALKARLAGVRYSPSGRIARSEEQKQSAMAAVSALVRLISVVDTDPAVYSRVTERAAFASPTVTLAPSTLRRAGELAPSRMDSA